MKTFAEIQLLVDARVPNWKRRAQRRTAKLKNLGYYHEGSSIWSEVKPIFMEIQHNKCAYCEQQVEGGPLGPIAHDLEHFRPKGGVRAWSGDLETYSFPTGAAFPEGYYRLAYHLGNYTAACKVCNSLLKSDYFPIAAARVRDADTPEACSAEEPHLVYPIGNTDSDPEQILDFIGVNAVPRRGPQWARAVVMIDFFGLNREGLKVPRAFTLLAVWEAFKGTERGDLESEQFLNMLTSNRAAHTSCAKAFRTLCTTDRPTAANMISKFRAIVNPL